MRTRVIDGRAEAAKIRAAVAAEISETGISPGLGVVLVGDDPASHLYVKLKEKACGRAGIRFEKHLFPAGASEGLVIEAVEALNRRGDIDAILVQLPLPAHLHEDAVVAAVDPEKDVDGFHPENVRAFLAGRAEAAPGLAAVLLALAEAAADLSGKNAAIVANSDVFAAPARQISERRGMGVETVTDLAVADRLTRRADLVVIAVGKPRWLTADKIKPGAIIIDVGTTRLGETVVGDADFEGLQGVAGAITPVPGGVGPMTVAMLLKNTLKLARRRAEK